MDYMLYKCCERVFVDLVSYYSFNSTVGFLTETAGI